MSGGGASCGMATATSLGASMASPCRVRKFSCPCQIASFSINGEGLFVLHSCTMRAIAASHSSSSQLLVFALLASLAGAVEHVHFIEGAGNNLLFRGGSPEVNKVFSYPALVASLQAAAKTSNVSFPPKFQLVLINVENLDTTLDSFTSEGECFVLPSRIWLTF
jgi:hypothetical protein